MLQGYMMAKDRLWQMEFLTHVAAGRVSEIIGEKAVNFDIEQRKKGMLYAANNALELYQSDTIMKRLLDDYTAGVNAYIDQLSTTDLPIEYKLLNYYPEKWTTLKCILIQKLMANDLTGDVDDFKNTAFKKDFSFEIFKELFPTFPDSVDAIVPNASIDNILVTQQSNTNKPENSNISNPLNNPKKTTNKPNPIPTFIAPTDNDTVSFLDELKPDRRNGSNNWAVSPSKSEDSSAMLCNDPHLALRLPSIWYQVHLTCPNMNVYGVSLPGAPLVVIGYNQSIAWGVTNASRDVLDYYKMNTSWIVHG
jgi:penicillin amidase